MSIFDARTGKYRYLSTQWTENLPFRIDMIGEDHCLPNYDLKRICSPICVIGFTLRGCGNINQNGIEVRAEEGSLFVLSMGQNHEYRPDGQWEFCWVNIIGPYFYQMLQQYGLDEQIIYPDCQLGQEFYELVKFSTDDAATLDEVQFQTQSFLMKLILYLYRAKNQTPKDSLAVKIRSEFEKDRSASLTQEQICKVIGITPRHAQRLFKQEYGITLHQFITNRRIMLAKALLCNTGSPIRQIAMDVGFSNEKYFSTFFSKVEGLSPSQYRKTYGCQRTDV